MNFIKQLAIKTGVSAIARAVSNLTSNPSVDDIPPETMLAINKWSVLQPDIPGDHNYPFPEAHQEIRKLNEHFLIPEDSWGIVAPSGRRQFIIKHPASGLESRWTCGNTQPS